MELVSIVGKNEITNILTELERNPRFTNVYQGNQIIRKIRTILIFRARYILLQHGNNFVGTRLNPN